MELLHLNPNFNILKQILQIFFISVLFMQCEATEKPKVDKTGFVVLLGKEFQIDAEPFFPMMLNYVVEFRYVDNTYMLGPAQPYEKPYVYETFTADSLQIQMNAHLKLIKQMGFNTIRVCFDRAASDSIGFFYPADGEKLYLAKDAETILAGLDGFLNLAEINGLKIMLLIKSPVDGMGIEPFTIKMLQHLSENPTLFAYDFKNEPLYFARIEGFAKKDALKTVQRWRELMDTYAPKQLLTIGFAEPIEAFIWDPSILPVDFLAFHTYNPLRVPNEIYWYSKYTNKPWMIGETALAADGDSISYDLQRQFMIEAYKRTVNCGGSGFGWWEFQEVMETFGSNFEASHTGLIDHHGEIRIDSSYTFLGSMKPAAGEVANLNSYIPDYSCPCMPNYFNMLGYENYMIKGRVVDKSTGKPIEGATVRGWNYYYAVGQNTFTDANGDFNLFSNDTCYHFEVSAPGMTSLKFDYDIHYERNPNSTLAESDLTDRNLEYHDIPFSPFLKNEEMKESNYSEPFIFDFEPSKFSRFHYQGRMNTLYLKPIYD